MVIVAAVDRSDRADIVIQEAKVLAEAFDDTIHVVHVIAKSEFNDIAMSMAKEKKEIDVESVRNAASNVAEEAAKSLDGSFVTVGLNGNPAEEVVNYAHEQEAQYIVVAGRKRSAAGKALFGSVAQSILMNAECPVVMSTESS